MMSLIETVDLYQRYGEVDILKNINLQVDRGEVFALIGPTGAGKTTLLRLLDLLDTPTTGKIYFDGVDTAKSAAERLGIRRRLAFVLQKPIVFNTSVYDNIAYGLKWRGVGKDDAHEKVSSLLETVGLSAYSSRNARTLSGGEVQRVAIARAIATEPEVLLLDEPTANLDPLSTSKIEEVVRNIRHQRDTTIIMATHDMLQGQRLADRACVLLDGEIQQTGDWKEIFNFPRSKEIADFAGVENIIKGVIVSSEDRDVTIDIGGNIIEAISDYPIEEEVCACVRPEDVTLAVSKLSSSARNSFVGEITRTVSMGPLTRVELDCGFPLVCLITKRSAEELDLKKGRQVYATFKATGVHVIKRENGI
ncbi:ABC transporter ATP-binding protein [Chloroflexota bacterium]